MFTTCFNLNFKRQAFTAGFYCALFLFVSTAIQAQKTGNRSHAAKTNPPATGKPAAMNPAVRDTAIIKLFSKPTELKWTKLFKGRLDDAAMVDISLGFDGKNCKGYLTYAKSHIRFQLEGSLDTSGFVLQERDMSRNITGKLTGSIEGRHLEADWANAGNSVGSKIEADEMPPGASISLNCSDDKWNCRYITRYNDARCDMVLLRTQNGALDGFLWVEADGRTYRLKGEIKADGDYEIDALGTGDRLAAILSGNLKAGQNMTCNWTGSGERRQFKFVLRDNFQLGCYAYADYASAYDVLYPRTACSTCNSWFDDQTNQWIDRCKSTFNEKKLPLTPTNRNAQRASAWPEIACWTDNLFSGYLTFMNTWSDNNQGVAFNFDLHTGKMISLDDIFQKSFNYQKWLADFAAHEMPKLASFAADPQYREWLAKEGFPLVVIRREGLELSTLFHVQYGRQTLFVPYTTLKPYLRKGSPIEEFLK